MFNLTHESILNKTTPLTFRRGSEYYKEKKIKSIQFNQKKLSFDAKVLGSGHYDVYIQFNRDEEIQRSWCTCPDHEGSGRVCKHIVAVLLLIKEKDEEGFFDQVKFRNAAKQIFSFFQNRQNIIKSPINLEITLEHGFEGLRGNAAFTGLSMRMGQGKLYVVRNIKDFFRKLERNEEIEFGKGFTFDPSRHDFKEEDKPLIAFMREIYDSEKLMDRFYSYNLSKGTLFRDKLVYLSNAWVKRFFEVMKGRSFNANIQGKSYENISIHEGDFPIQFVLSKSGSDLILSMEFEGPLLPLTDKGEYFLAGNKIYKPTRQQQENFKPFYMAMTYQKGNKIRFLEEDKEKFVSEVLPFTEKVGQLMITENVQSMIEKAELEPEIYLDRSGDSVVADIKFIYGERMINPFAPVEKPAQPTEKILIRDMEKERMILDILGESEFKVRNHQIYLEEEEKVFGFIFDVVPKLQEYARVYYSESFKRMTLRSHAVFSGGIRLNTENDMLEFSFSIDGIDPTELEKVFESLREKKKYFRLKDGSYLPLDTEEVKQMADVLEYLELDKDGFNGGFAELPKYRAMYLDQRLKESGIRFLDRNHAFKEFVHHVKEPADTDFEVPPEVKPVLREYQRFGFKWLKTLAEYGLGGILADDMGLGKTLQVIALILSDKMEKGPHPSMVVVPTSLVYNWCLEVEKFAPALKVVAISGSKVERSKLMETIQEADLVVTSYPLIRRDIEDYADYKFRYCILDEAQHIKNPGSQNAKSVKGIRAEKRFALTGTPMENSLTELWSIFDFILPGYLFSHNKFMTKYETPIVKGESREAVEDLSRQLKPFILRRLKKEVLRELPEKIEHKMITELTEEQKKIYLAYLEKIRYEVNKEIEEKGFERSQIVILSGLTRLRQICCHPSVFLEGYRGESGKMQLLQEIIQDALDSGHRMLLFSQFTSMLGIIRDWLKSERIDYLYLDGSTPSEERGKLVKAFNGGQGKVFLISLKAGGTGLNLTGADTVIHYDPWWNPAVEDQATDRAYRIGQNKSVHVMKLITRGTIEEKIYALQEKKKELIDSVIQPGETLLTKMTQEEMRALFE